MQRLFIYGTLAPGQPNEHIMSDIKGDWTPATTRGTLIKDGWGAALGYPGILPNDEGEEVSGLVFSSNELHNHWSMLDEFEGEGYRRIKVKVALETGQQTDAWIYALNQQDSE